MPRRRRKLSKRKLRAARGKRRAQNIHSTRRALERFDAILLHGELIGQIQNGKATFVRRQSNRITIWKVEQDGVEMTAVYDKLRKTIVTVY